MLDKARERVRKITEKWVGYKKTATYINNTELVDEIIKSKW